MIDLPGLASIATYFHEITGANLSPGILHVQNGKPEHTTQELKIEARNFAIIGYKDALFGNEVIDYSLFDLRRFGRRRSAAGKSGF
jgi:hypothetical protein